MAAFEATGGPICFHGPTKDAGLAVLQRVVDGTFQHAARCGGQDLDQFAQLCRREDALLVVVDDKRLAGCPVPPGPAVLDRVVQAPGLELGPVRGLVEDGHGQSVDPSGRPRQHVLQISALVSRFRHHFDGEKAVIKLWVFEDQALDVVDPPQDHLGAAGRALGRYLYLHVRHPEGVKLRGRDRVEAAVPLPVEDKAVPVGEHPDGDQRDQDQEHATDSDVKVAGQGHGCTLASTREKSRWSTSPA